MHKSSPQGDPGALERWRESAKVAPTDWTEAEGEHRDGGRREKEKKKKSKGEGKKPREGRWEGVKEGKKEEGKGRKEGN